MSKHQIPTVRGWGVHGNILPAHPILLVTRISSVLLCSGKCCKGWSLWFSWFGQTCESFTEECSLLNRTRGWFLNKIANFKFYTEIFSLNKIANFLMRNFPTIWTPVRCASKGMDSTNTASVCACMQARGMHAHEVLSACYVQYNIIHSTLQFV